MSDLIGTDDPFSESEKNRLREILGFMIPQQGSRPAANDPVIFADFLTVARPHAELVGQALKRLEGSSLEALSRSRTPDVSALVSFAVQCYYRDDRVMAALEMEARPPHPVGFELQEGDWTLLEPVRARGKIYRDA